MEASGRRTCSDLRHRGRPLKLPGIARAFGAINDAVNAIAAASRAGTSFVFGYLGGGQLPYDLKIPGAEFVLALQALPIVLVMSVLTTLLFYWRILPPIVRGFSWLLERTLGVGGAVGLSTAANIFLGMVEAPLFIRPYLASLTRSELFMVMTGGMAGIAGTVLVIYATLLGTGGPGCGRAFRDCLGDRARRPRSWSAAIMVPERSEKHDRPKHVELAPVASSTMDAIVKGTAAGLELLLNICAMLIVLVALVHLANAIIGTLLPVIGGAPITLQRLLGYADGPGLLAHGNSLAGGGDRRRAHGNQDGPQRIHRLRRAFQAALRRTRPALPPDHALRHVRLRQFRLARHHDRRTFRHGAGTARRGDIARSKVDRVGHDRDLPHGRSRRDAHASISNRQPVIRSVLTSDR